MELIYRGTIYERHPSKASGRPFRQVREPEVAYNLSYRGVTYRVDPNPKPMEVPVEPVAYKLIYRGVTYFKLSDQGVTYSVNRNL
jgi:YHS domain-containing protein